MMPGTAKLALSCTLISQLDRWMSANVGFWDLIMGKLVSDYLVTEAHEHTTIGKCFFVVLSYQ